MVNRFKNLTFLILLWGFIFASGSMLSGQEVIKGLLYYDQSPVAIEIENGIIKQISRMESWPDDAPKVYIAPGFIDNQVNGFADVTFALGGGRLSMKKVRKATQTLWEYGVTTYLPTLTTNSDRLFTRHLSILKKAIKRNGLHGSVAGIHLEGPYINPEDGYRGAHPLEHVRLPDWDEFMRYQRASGGNIIQVTVAPEMEGALDFISKCSQQGVIVALGHHNAPAETVTAAIDRGAKIATHLGNGAANMINRHRNPFWSQLADDRLSASIICDSFHLLPEEIRVFYRVKGVEKTILTSDVTSYGSLPPGNYRSGEGHSIQITPEGMLWNNDQGGLYGSASPLIKSVGHVMEVTGCSLGEAVQMASGNPAKLYGLTDRGALEPGKRADIVLFTMENFELSVCKTWVNGKLVYKNPVDK